MGTTGAGRRGILRVLGLIGPCQTGLGPVLADFPVLGAKCSGQTGVQPPLHYP